MRSEDDGENAPVSLIRAGVEQSDLVAPLFQAYCEFYGRTISVEQAKAYIEDGLTLGDSVVFLALQHSDYMAAPRAVGFTQMHPSRSQVFLSRRWIINDLYVAPDARRGGVGRKLLEAAKAFALSTNAKDMVLRTAQTNGPARALYQSLGWVEDEIAMYYKLRL